MTQELLSAIAFSLIPKVSCKLLQSIVNRFESIEEVYAQPFKELSSVKGMTDEICSAILSKSTFATAEAELLFIEKNKIQTYYYYHDHYPSLLQEIEDAPILLYGLGRMDFNKPALSIVGTRHATSYGKKLCEDLVNEIAQKQYNINIISGLAMGIDGYAHTTAIHQQLDTIAVLGHGLDMIYPPQHKNIATQMIAKGGLLTEFPSKTRITGTNFLSRNRIIAGLSQGVIIVESAFRGGALNTACLAQLYNREVMAFPGKVQDKMSVGCNNLIKTQRAILISGFQDVETILNWSSQAKPKEKKMLNINLFDNFSPEQQKILQLLNLHETEFSDNIARHLTLSIAQTNTLLLDLELQGIITSLPGKKYKIA